MPHRRGFTLIELLIVISIIATLSAMSVPAIGFVQRMVKDLRCGNNLQQIGVAIETFKNDHEDQFPYYLSLRIKDAAGNPISDASGNPLKDAAGNLQTSLTRRRDALLAGSISMFQCPRDTLVGTPSEDPNMGRKPPQAWGDVSMIWEPGCSYLYQASGRIAPSNYRDWFVKGLPANDPRRTTDLTWATAKVIQLKTGNYSDSISNARGGAFDANRFPIIQCFHHFNWEKATAAECISVKKVKCVSWNLNVFEATSSWEGDIDPRFYQNPPP